MRKFFEAVIYSLPTQLTFLHFRKNLALLAVWGIILAAFTGGLGKVYGIQYLFLDPEYQGEVGFWSFFWVGMAFGNLIIAYHITCYILDGHRFRFIAVLSRPFTKFSLNNSIIPLLILVTYLVTMIGFQFRNEFASKIDILLYVLGLISGINVLIFLMFLYFRFTNKDIFKFVASTVDRQLRKNILSRQRMMDKIQENKQDAYKVSSYLDFKLRVRSTAEIANFSNREAILKVFDQNHFNSVLVELIFIGIILLLGLFIDYPLLQIPAAASALIIFSIAVMLVGAISFWFKGWGLAFALGIFILVNLVVKSGLGKGINEAAGLDYDSGKISYTVEELQTIHSREQYIHDKLHMLETLENWKKKWPDSRKRKMVFTCVSGGGQRAALWTVNSLLKIDSILQGSLMDQSFLITGASGGVIGAAYYREMFRRNELAKMGPQMLENIGKDNLNPVIFSLLVNDLFIKLQTYEHSGRTYSVDRGYTFEKNLNNNLEGVLSMNIEDYKDAESSAEIPTLIMSPTIANDGRKLYISSQPVSYMGVSTEILNDGFPKVRGADFQILFRDQSPGELSFLSALRMSASFPYITPSISLPSSPRIEIMDAGISDNFGVSDALRFIYVFKDWIAENTDGVVLLVIRDTKSNSPIEDRPIPSVMDRLTYPIASVYNNLITMQDINNDVRIENAGDWFSGELDVVEVAYDSYYNTQGKSEVERASLSWHLTTREKKNIIENINIEGNRKALERLKAILKE
ncbi:MAG: patatin-like phospholipase family protein [Cyclobacteriaceae bacterium]